MSIKTNKDKLLELNVIGEVSHPQLFGGLSYITTWDGLPKLSIGYGGIKYNVKVGDPVFNWPNTDHVEPGVSITNKDTSSNLSLGSYSCIGNQALVISGEAKGSKGFVTGKSGYVTLPDNVLLDFPGEVLEKLAIGDSIQIRAKGLGLSIEGFDAVKLFGIDPELLLKFNVKIEGGKLIVPVTHVIPPELMGHGVGERPGEFGYWCIQTNCLEAMQEFGFESMRIGDIVALKDQYCGFGRGYYKDGLTIGVVVHGASEISGHGPGVNPIMTSKASDISTSIYKKANISNYLRLRSPK
jgi:hypothetical protein